MTTTSQPSPPRTSEPQTPETGDHGQSRDGKPRDGKSRGSERQTSVKIVVPGEHSMVSLLGTGDELLGLVADAFDSSVHVRGNEITITGEPDEVDEIADLFDELIAVLSRGHALDKNVVTETIRMVQTGADERPSQVLTQTALTHRGRTIRPKTLGQKRYLDTIRDHTVTFSIGPAGTGKTYLAMAAAVGALRARDVNRLIITRPAVEAGESLGYLPGTLQEKIDPYLRPLWDALHDMFEADDLVGHMDRGTIEVAPLAYMRGRTLNDSFVVLDEAQNTTAEQMKMFLTRIGFGSKAVVTGDITQVDLPTGSSGLRIVRDILDGIDGVAFTHLGADDVVRHPIVQRIVEAYERHENSPSTSAG